MSVQVERVAEVIAMLRQGVSQREVARNFGMNVSTVHRLLRRHEETGLLTRRPGSGRKRCTSARDDRYIVTSMLRNRHQTAVQIQHELQDVRGTQISARTARRRMKDSGLTPHRPATGPQLTRAHRVARLQFAQLHHTWSMEQWSRVLFSDESRIGLYGADGRDRVYRRSGERYAQCNISERVSFQGGSIMVWGGITLESRTELVIIENGSLNAARYVTDILEQHVLPHALFIGESFLLMHDNARPHTARCVDQYLSEVGIRRMSWPARSPDLNPIEHIWSQLKTKIRNRTPAPTSIAALKIAALEEWERIPQEDIRNLIRGMDRRMTEVISKRGGNTHY